MKRTRRPKLVVLSLPKVKASNVRPGSDEDDPITTSGAICTLIAQS